MGQQPVPGGYIKLWRSMLFNGHLAMPVYAFKVWIYLLLRVNHKKNAGCQPGEGWISYDMIRERCSDPARGAMPNSTISRALGYLAGQGYIERVQVKTGAPQQIRILNWRKYQGKSGSEEIHAAILGAIHKQEGLRIDDYEEVVRSLQTLPDAVRDNWGIAYQYLFVTCPPMRYISQFDLLRRDAGITDRLIVHLIEEAITKKRRNPLAWAHTVASGMVPYGVKTVEEYVTFEAQREAEDAAKRTPLRRQERPHNAIDEFNRG